MWKPLRECECLPSSLRTSVVIRLRRVRAIESTDEKFGSHRSHVQRPESKIEQLLPAERKARTLLNCRRMAGIGGRGREPCPHCARMVRDPSRSIEGFPCPSAVTEHIEAAVPVDRKVHLDIDLGLRHQK